MINAAAMEIGIGVVGAEGAIAALDSVTGAFQTAVDTAAQAELSQLSLRSLVGSEMVATGQYRDLAAATDEAAVYAQHLYDWTKCLAIQSPYESQDITNAVSLAQAYGFLSTQTTSVEVAQQAGVISTQRLTAATLDYLAAAGRPSNVLENIVTPLGQIKAVGRATGEEMRQLAEWGVPVRRYLAEALNVSTAEIVQMQNEGRLLAEDVIPAIVEGFERDFGGAAASMGGTISGLLSSMNELASYSLADFFGPTIEAGQGQLQALVDSWGGSKGSPRLRQSTSPSRKRESLRGQVSWLLLCR